MMDGDPGAPVLVLGPLRLVFGSCRIAELPVRRRRTRRAPAWYVVISPVLIVVVAFPVVAAGIWLINYALPYLWHAVLAHHTLHNPVHMPHRVAWLGTYLAGFPWQPAVIGILAGLVVHRVYAPAGNTVQLYFIGRSVDRTRDAVAAGEENPGRHLQRAEDRPRSAEPYRRAAGEHPSLIPQ